MWIAGGWGEVILEKGTRLSAVSWTVEWSVDVIDVTTFKSTVFASSFDGVPDFDIRVECIFDDLENPFKNLVTDEVRGLVSDFMPGAYVRMLLGIQKNSTVRFEFPRVLLTETPMETTVRDTVRYTLSGRADHYFPVVTHQGDVFVPPFHKYPHQA